MSIILKTDGQMTILMETKSFSGGERHLQLHDLPEDKPEYFEVQCFIHNSDDLMDLLLLQNALDQHYQSPVNLKLEIPYLPYARQDRVCAIGQAFSLQVMSDLLKMLNIQQLIVWDCHSPVGEKLTGAINIEGLQIIEQSPELVRILQDKNSVLICPDKGALNRCTELSYHFNIQEMVLCEKIRDPKTGKITHTQVNTDDLTGKTAIITDDICDGGYTFIRIAQQLKKLNVDKIILYVTHGIFSKGMSVFEGLVDHIYTTQSFTHEPHDKLSIISFKHNQS